jgi:SAM-dependent methyltransferase
MLDEVREAERTLRPNEEQATRAWRTLVTAEKEQVERLPERPRPEDFYAPVAGSFRADPGRSDDPVLEHLRPLVRPEETWLDLGAGGGRYTLPIALTAKAVYAVEPSRGMLEVLAQAQREAGIANVETFAERWPGESKAPVADVALICQVGYDIAEIGAFLDQMEAHARRLCVAVMFHRAPISDFGALWEPVHGEPRVELPALAEFVALLFARGSVPQIETFEIPPRTYTDLAALQSAARRPLWVLPGSPRDATLAGAIEERAVAVEGGVALSRGPRRLGLVTWQPRVSG